MTFWAFRREFWLIRWRRNIKGGRREPEGRLQRPPDQPRGRFCGRPDGQEDDRVLREEPVTGRFSDDKQGLRRAAGPALYFTRFYFPHNSIPGWSARLPPEWVSCTRRRCFRRTPPRVSAMYLASVTSKPTY